MNGSFSGALIRSSTDFKFYKEIFLQPFGVTLRYLLLLTILVTALIGIRYGVAVNKFVKEGLTWMEANAPYIEITDGVVKADVEQPYTAESKDFVMIIDTTGKVNTIDQKYKTGVLLTKEKLIVKNDEIRAQEFDLRKVKKFVIDKPAFAKWKKFLVYILIPFIVLMQFFYFFIVKIIQSLVASMAVLVAKPGLRLSNVLNVCVYALTPVTLLSLIVTLASPRPIPLFWLIYIGMYIAFIIGALSQCLIPASGAEHTEA